MNNITVEIIYGYLEKFDYYYQFDTAQKKLLVETVVKRVAVENYRPFDLSLSLPLLPLGSYDMDGSKW